MALSPEQSDAILAGVASCDTLFYVVGGAVLVILAGYWGFYQVVKLMGGHADVDSIPPFPGDDDLGDESIFNQRQYLSERAENPDWRD